jgi:hypothetical protein
MAHRDAAPSSLIDRQRGRSSGFQVAMFGPNIAITAVEP